MKVVFPERPAATSGRTRTLTQTIMVLAPSSADAINAGFLFALCAISLVGLANTFDSWQFLFVGLLGVLLGMFSGHLTRALRWHWLVVVFLVLVEFFLLGSALALHDDALFGFLPTLGTLGSLVSVGVTGWKSLLTTLPPVDGGSHYVALPYLLGLTAGGVGYVVAKAAKRPGWVIVTPTGLFVAVILLGTLQPVAALAQGLGFAVCAFSWMAYRFRQRGRLTGTGRSNRTRLVTGAAMIAVALAVGGALGGLLPGGATPRFILRSYVQPPIDMSQYASPLEAFRIYSSKTLGKLYDQPIVKVEGVKSGTLLRFAVLDDYSSHAWTAVGGSGGAATGFQTIGSSIPNESAQGKTAVKVTIEAGYAASIAGSLSMWVPSLGETSGVVFSGPNAKAHAGAFRFNLTTMQGVVLDQLKTGDVITVTSSATTTDLGSDPEPDGSPSIGADKFVFLAAAEKTWSGDASSASERLKAVEAALKLGYWSDGTRAQEEQYLPGHGQKRLEDFVKGQELVGSDEQYAATFALLANRIGFPARVVMGAAVPDGLEIKGSDVTAWVEIRTTSGWVTIPASDFTPDRENYPPKTPQSASLDKGATVVPPPNPVRAPGSFDQLGDGELAGLRSDGGWLASLSRLLLGILAIVGPPLGVLALLLSGILAVKGLRSRLRRRRGSPAVRVVAGWRDVLDRVRDMGILVPAGHTRLEESRLIGAPAVVALAVQANVAIFGPDEPDEAMASEYWAGVVATKRMLLTSLGRWRRLSARLNLRSLLPERFASIQLPRVSRPRWFKVPAVKLRTPQASTVPEG